MKNKKLSLFLQLLGGVFTFVVGLSLIVDGCNAQTFKLGDNSNIIITCGHAGWDKGYIKRDCKDKSVNCINDLYTDKIAESLVKEFGANYVYNNYHRKYVDVNRPIHEGCDNNECDIIHSNYHNMIHNTISSLRLKHDVVYVIDIHGHTGNELIFGFDGTDNINELCKYFNLFNYNCKNNYKFNGGYTTETYNTYNNVIAFQIEIPSYIRKNKKARDRFIDNFVYVFKQINNKNIHN